MTVENDELSAEREEQIIGEMLRERGGIDPATLEPVVRIAALGLVNGAWRNTCIEDWHAEGRLHDGDMLRINSHTTWRVRQVFQRWTAEPDCQPTGCYPRWTTYRRRMSTGSRSGCTGGWSIPGEAPCVVWESVRAEGLAGRTSPPTGQSSR